MDNCKYLAIPVYTVAFGINEIGFKFNIRLIKSLKVQLWVKDLQYHRIQMSKMRNLTEKMCYFPFKLVIKRHNVYVIFFRRSPQCFKKISKKQLVIQMKIKLLRKKLQRKVMKSLTITEIFSQMTGKIMLWTTDMTCYLLHNIFLRPKLASSSSTPLLVNAKQRGNPILKHVHNVAWEYSDIIPDYILGRTTCALFLRFIYKQYSIYYYFKKKMIQKV